MHCLHKGQQVLLIVLHQAASMPTGHLLSPLTHVTVPRVPVINGELLIGIDTSDGGGGGPAGSRSLTPLC